MNSFAYKGYVGVPEVDADAGVIRGLVVNTRDTITFQGVTVADAEREFRASVDDYLSFCTEQGQEPEKPFSGKFPVRTTPAVHKELAVKAARKGISLNKYVERLLMKDGRTGGRPGRLRQDG
jgi:predicted HicB family RNase H-like nuclease